MAVRAAIGLGSNLGDRARHIAEAIGSLAEHGRLVAVSALYETAPIGGPEQGNYLNAVAVFETDLGPHGLLEVCLQIEQSRGRMRRERWGPRTLDLDILIYGDLEIDEPGLTIPHPRMAERRFVLEPLAEAWPDATLPDGRRPADLLPAVADQSVRRLAGPPQPRRLTIAVFLVTGIAAVVLWWLLGWLF